MKTKVRELIEELEIELRRFINNRLQVKYAQRWPDILKANMSETENRVFENDKHRELNNLIDYTYIGTLKSIIFKEWQDFKQFFKEKRWLDERVSTIIEARNVLAHPRNFNSKVLKRAEVDCEDILDILNPEWRGQLAKRKEDSRTKTKRSLAVVSLIIIAAGLSFAVFYSQRSRKIPVVEVLPFKNLTKDAGLDNFSGMFSEVVKNKLALCNKLFVMDLLRREKPEEGLFIKNAYAAEEKELIDLKKYGVNILIKGSYFKAGDKFKIMARIVDLERNRVITSADYEGAWNESELLAVQNKLAYKVIEALNISLDSSQKSNIDKVALPNPDAYELFSKTWDLYRQGKYDEVLELCKKTLLIDPNFLDAYRRLGNVYEMLGNKDEALRQYKIYEKLAYESNDPSSSAQALLNIGMIYKYNDDHGRELDYYNKSLGVSLRSKDDINTARAYNALGCWYLNKDLYKDALVNFVKAEGINKAKDYIYRHKYNLAGDYLGIGKASEALGELRKAQEYYDKGLSLYKELEGKIGIAESYCLLAELAYKNKQCDIAVEHYKNALAVNTDLKNKKKSEEIEARINEIQAGDMG